MGESPSDFPEFPLFFRQFNLLNFLAKQADFNIAKGNQDFISGTMGFLRRLIGELFGGVRARKNSESGSALLEAAITIPPTIFLLFYMVDAGRMMHNHHVFTQMVADTLRFASSLNDIEEGTVTFESGSYQGCAADGADPQCTKQRMILFRAKELVERDTRLSISDLIITSNYSAVDDRITLRVAARYRALFPAIWQHDAISASGGVGDVSNG